MLRVTALRRSQLGNRNQNQDTFVFPRESNRCANAECLGFVRVSPRAVSTKARELTQINAGLGPALILNALRRGARNGYGAAVRF
jgi:hypothetical protein